MGLALGPRSHAPPTHTHTPTPPPPPLTRVDDKLARRVAQAQRLLVEELAHALQRQHAQRVLGHRHKALWHLLAAEACGARGPGHREKTG